MPRGKLMCYNTNIIQLIISRRSRVKDADAKVRVGLNMNITIIGAGALGGYFGGRMLEAGLDVTFLVRERRAEQLKLTGLMIRSSHGDSNIDRVKLAVRAGDIEACNLVIVAVKNYHLKQVMEPIRSLVNKGAKVLPLLNGVEHFEILQQAFGADHVLGGVCQIIATLDNDGRIIQNGSLHNLMIGALHPDQVQLCRQLGDLFADANMECLVKENITFEIWMKYAFIVAFSGVTTASRLGIQDVLSIEPTHEVFHQTLIEMQKLANANGVKLPGNFPEIILQRMQKLPLGSTSSMHQDFTKGLPLEVESLHGGAIRLATRLGIEIPTVRALYGLIKPYDRGLRGVMR
jgi:2-dehydropantoate 2-reductase